MDDQQIFKRLEETDWVTVGVWLLAKAVMFARTKSWRGKRGISGPDDELAEGLSCHDVVQNVIKKTIKRKRKWDPEKGDLEPWLAQQVRSEISNLNDRSPHKHERADLPEEDGDGVPASALTSAQDTYSCDPLLVMLEQEKNEKDKELLASIIAAADSDPELLEVLDALMDGCEPKPRFLAAKLGTSTEDINNRRRRLRRLALRL